MFLQVDQCIHMQWASIIDGIHTSTRSDLEVVSDAPFQLSVKRVEVYFQPLVIVTP